MRKVVYAAVLAVLMAGTAGIVGYGSSHREAPGITKVPKVDGTDFYMFRSYEAGRAEFVTLIANYYPFQEPFGGPNFFMLDEDAVYEIHVDNNGDAREDLTFQLQFQRLVKELAVPVGDRMIPVPLINIGGIGPGVNDTANLNVEESYTLRLIRGARRTGQSVQITNANTGSGTFQKPVDRIGDKSIRDNNPNVYDQYADNHIYNVDIPGCGVGRVFVGQRREGFVINVAEAFDLINTNPLGPIDGETNDLAGKNITTLAFEVPISCLTAGGSIIGGWTTASAGRGTPASGGGNGGVGAACTSQPSTPKPAPNWVPTADCLGWVPPGHPGAGAAASAGGGASSAAQATTCPAGQPSSVKPAPNWVPTADCQGWVPPDHPSAGAAPGGGSSGTPPGQFTQVSRLGHPLVNEVVIGLPHKDAFNASEPSGDTQFLQYVTHPTLPVLIQALFGVPPPAVPRNDLVQVFLTGIPGLNQPSNVTPSEMLRLNTSTAPIPPASQNPLGVIAGDNAGYPNGRRPGDDVVDIALRVVEGLLLSSDPSSFPPFTDGAFTNATIAYDPMTGMISGDANMRLFRDTFPYLRVPLSPSPKPFHQ